MKNRNKYQRAIEQGFASPSRIDHPAHYGGGDNPYEAIKVVEAWDLGFCLGNTVKYIARAPHKGSALEDLKKAAWYLNRYIESIERDTQNGKQDHAPTTGRRPRKAGPDNR